MPLDILPSFNVKLFLTNPSVIPPHLALHVSLCGMYVSTFFRDVPYEKEASDFVMAP